LEFPSNLNNILDGVGGAGSCEASTGSGSYRGGPYRDHLHTESVPRAHIMPDQSSIVLAQRFAATMGHSYNYLLDWKLNIDHQNYNYRL